MESGRNLQHLAGVEIARAQSRSLPMAHGILLAICVLLVPALISPALPAVLAGQSQSDPAHTEPPPPSAYAGDAACAECHGKQAATYALTNHARDSAPATAGHVLGNFHTGRNVLHTSDPDLVVNMIARPDGFYQNAINLADPSNHLEERFDIVIGSGRHGQTYLYWDDNELYELPVSWWTYDHKWVLSPGMPDGQIHFDRPIVPRCLECHASYFTWQPPLSNQDAVNHFVKDSVVLGIQCERCHGPGAEHVKLERAATSKPTPARDPAIINPARFARDRQIDLCALCHAGAVNPIAAPLTFLPGDKVSDYIDIQPAVSGQPVDVHGNQVGALKLSKCFASSSMTCSTCHNVHQTQEDAAAYSHNCLECHKMQTCGKFRTLGQAIRTRCVDCHMPIGDSNKIVSTTGGQTLQARMRTHQIAIYPDASALVEQTIKPR